MRLLAVDDDAATRLLIRRVLERDGWEVILAEDGPQALALFRTDPPDLVVTDYQMPGMDGVELCRRLVEASEGRFVPLVMLTSGQDSDLLPRSLEAGALEFLNKPVRPEELRSRMRALASLARMHNALAEAQAENEHEITVVKHLLERLTAPGLRTLPPGFVMETLQTRRINGDACAYLRGPRGIHFGLVCDATGHGLVAGVSTLPVLETFNAMAPRDLPLESVYNEVNEKLIRLLPPERFACLLLLRLDPEEGALRILNAGMPDLVHLGPEGEILGRIPSGNLPAGITRHSGTTRVAELRVRPGERIFAHSDGLADLLREEGIRELLLPSRPSVPAGDLPRRLRQSVEGSLLNAEQHDDISWSLWEVPEPHPILPPPPPRNPGRIPTQLGFSVAFEADPRHHDVRDLVPNILGLLGFQGVPRPQVELLGILASEALNNAVDHGLLRLDSRLKGDGFQVWEAARRAAIQSHAGGTVRCEIRLAYSTEGDHRLDHLAVEVSDGGPGFDWRSIRDTREGTEPHGRGLLLLSTLAQDLEFNESGNTLRFRIPCQGPPPE
ncbi:MAG: fused response regulator/phosphatase [Acidobacteria bacterium]|nr:fused response regulator/phosphatase [Acidobacteriota bacterium]